MSMSERALSWPMAAGIISGLLVVVLGGEWLLSRAARPASVDAHATAAPRALVATLGAAPTAAPNGVTMPLPTVRAAATVAATPGSLPTTTSSASTGRASTGSAATAVSFSTGARSGITPIALPTLQPTATPSGWWDASSDVPADQRAQLEQAYTRFWQIRGQALLELDANRLTEVMAGAELTAEQQGIENLRSNGRAQRVDVDHHERITWATADAATILDEYVSHTVLVDAETKEPVEDPPSAPFRLAYLFRKVDGRWLAVDAVRVVYAP